MEDDYTQHTSEIVTKARMTTLQCLNNKWGQSFMSINGLNVEIFCAGFIHNFFFFSFFMDFLSHSPLPLSPSLSISHELSFLDMSTKPFLSLTTASSFFNSLYVNDKRCDAFKKFLIITASNSSSHLQFIKYFLSRSIVSFCLFVWWKLRKLLKKSHCHFILIFKLKEKKTLCCEQQ